MRPLLASGLGAILLALFGEEQINAFCFPTRMLLIRHYNLLIAVHCIVSFTLLPLVCYACNAAYW